MGCSRAKDVSKMARVIPACGATWVRENCSGGTGWLYRPLALSTSVVTLADCVYDMLLYMGFCAQQRFQNFADRLPLKIIDMGFTFLLKKYTLQTPLPGLEGALACLIM